MFAYVFRASGMAWISHPKCKTTNVFNVLSLPLCLCLFHPLSVVQQHIFCETPSELWTLYIQAKPDTHLLHILYTFKPLLCTVNTYFSNVFCTQQFRFWTTLAAAAAVMVKFMKCVKCITWIFFARLSMPRPHTTFRFSVCNTCILLLFVRLQCWILCETREKSLPNRLNVFFPRWSNEINSVVVCKFRFSLSYSSNTGKFMNKVFFSGV